MTENIQNQDKIFNNKKSHEINMSKSHRVSETSKKLKYYIENPIELKEIIRKFLLEQENIQLHPINHKESTTPKKKKSQIRSSKSIRNVKTSPAKSNEQTIIFLKDKNENQLKKYKEHVFSIKKGFYDGCGRMEMNNFLIAELKDYSRDLENEIKEKYEKIIEDLEKNNRYLIQKAKQKTASNAGKSLKKLIEETPKNKKTMIPAGYHNKGKNISHEIKCIVSKNKDETYTFEFCDNGKILVFKNIISSQLDGICEYLNNSLNFTENNDINSTVFYEGLKKILGNEETEQLNKKVSNDKGYCTFWNSISAFYHILGNNIEETERFLKHIQESLIPNT
tara:strand:+ start:1441 stop:2451 length:1011 start_codon:yes stop_codon:yes gene_type:complete